MPDKINWKSIPSKYRNEESRSPLYQKWIDIRRRVKNKNRDNYKWYGAKGIGVDSKWLNSFDEFKKWSVKHGYNANKGKLSPDRIDESKSYTPDNVRWISKKANVKRVLDKINNKRSKK